MNLINFSPNSLKLLENNCANCSAKQKKDMKKLINVLETKKQTQWKEIQAKYDPTGEKTRRFKAENP